MSEQQPIQQSAESGAPQQQQQAPLQQQQPPTEDEKQQLLRLGEHAIRQAEHAVEAQVQRDEASGSVTGPSPLQAILRSLACLKVEDAATLSAIMTHGMERVVRTPTPTLQKQQPPPPPLTPAQQLARATIALTEAQRLEFVSEIDKEEQRMKQQQQAAAATQPSVKQEHKEQREAQSGQAAAMPFHLFASRLPSTAAAPAPSSSLFAPSPLASMLDPTSQLGLASFFKLLDIDKAKNAPKLQSPQQFMQWRAMIAAFLQSHDCLQVVEQGSAYLSLPVDLPTQASRTAALPLIQQGLDIGPSGHDQERKLDRQRLIWAHTALTYAVDGVPLALQAVTSVPMPNATEAWKRLEKVMLPRTLGDRLIKEQEFMQLQQFPPESIAAYAARTQQLATQLAGLGSQQAEESLMARFISGIRSLSPSRRDLLLASASSLQDAITKATNFETQERLEKQLKSGGRGQQQGGGESSSSAFGAFFGRKGQQQANMKCFICGKKGHMAKDCRSGQQSNAQRGGRGGQNNNNSSSTPVTCTWCRKQGHTEAECRQKKAGKPKNMSGGASHAAALEPSKHMTFMSMQGDSFVAELVQAEEPHSAHAAAQPMAPLQDVLLDTGATHNMVKSDVQLESSRPLIGTAIRTAGKQVLSNPSVGQLQLYSASASLPLQLTNVLSHPQLSRSLLSISSLVDRPDVKHCVFGKQGAQLIGTNGDVMLTGSRKGGLYILDAASAASHAATVEEQQKIHARLGHMGRTMLSKLIQSKAVTGLEHLVLRQSIECDSCKESKATILPFKAQMPEQYRATRSLQRMHADLHGPIQQPSLSGARFSLVMLDEFSDFGFVEPIKSKDEAADKIKKIVKQLHTQFGVYPAEIHTDRGGEFLSGDLLDFYKECGIKPTQAPPYTPQLNGRAERFNRTLITAARVMLIAAKAPKALWGEAIVSATFLHNRLKVHDDGSTPLQRLTGKRITTDIHLLHPFGCTAFVAVPNQINKQKYDPVGVKMTFVGWEDPVGFRLLGLTSSNKVIISRNVKFLDDDFSAMRSWSESQAEAEQEEESEEWLEEAIWRNEQRLTIEESKREYEREQERKQAPEPEVAPQQQQVVAPRPLRPSQRQPQPPSREFSPPFSSSPSEASGSEYTPSPSLSDEGAGRGRKQRSAKPKQPKGAPPLRSSTRSTRGQGPFRLGMVSPRDLGMASYPATMLPHDLTPAQMEQVESIMEDLVFGAQADVIPRGSSPYQEAQRQAAIDAEQNNQPFPLDRPHCNKHGEIVISQRCVGIKRNGEQCGAHTKHGSLCWNHLQKEANLRIKKSVLIPAAGKGLMAAGKDFKTGEHVAKYTGDLSTDPDVEHGGSKYVVGLSNDVTLDAARSNTAPGRMINDPKGTGLRPNATFVIDNRRRKVRIQTTRPVHDKEEFLLSYGRSYWNRINELKAEQAAKKKAKRKAKRAAKKAAASAAELQQLFAERDPITHAQAMASADAERWKQAELAEQKSLEDMKVYRFVTEVPAGAKLLDSKPVYKRKRDNNGVVVRFKNRLVARGFLQRAAIDFDSTFAPTLSYPTIRVMLAMAAVHDFELKTMDVETAFLHAPLDRQLYMKIPVSFSNVPVNAVALELQKSLYGLHQSGKLWNEMLSSALIELGFEAGKNGDMCTFVQQSRSGHAIVLGVFVDDIIYMYKKEDEPQMEEIKSKLMSKFKIKDLGDAAAILGMRIKRDRAARSIELDQEQYVKQCCALLGLSSTKPLPTPENIAAAHRSLSNPAAPRSSSSTDSDSGSSDEEDISNETKLTLSNYRSAVGMLGYAALASRPDVAHAYSMAARKQQNPTQEDLTALAHAFRYLLGSATRSLRFSNDSTGMQLIAFSDADWAGDSADARSTSGILLKLGGAAVSWSSTKQSNVALSSSEAEYIAASETGREIVAMRILLAELGQAQAAPTPLRIDNETAIRMALEEGNHGRRKHINVKHHYLRELVADKLVVLEWVPTLEQQADMLTKATSRSQFFAMRDLAMGHSLTAHAQFTEQLTFAQAQAECTKLS